MKVSKPSSKLDCWSAPISCGVPPKAERKLLAIIFAMGSEPTNAKDLLDPNRELLPPARMKQAIEPVTQRY
jgi:hypothetical protein